MRLRTVIGIVVGLLLAGLLGVGLFLAGISLGAHSDSRNSLRSSLPTSLARSLLGPPGLFPLQQEVLQQLRTGYYREVDPDTLEADTIRGMLAGLDDPYTTYFTPKEYGSFKEHTEGQYSGLGMVVEMKNGFVTVISTFKGSPAQDGGIRPGDLVIGVDGKTARGVSLDEVVDRIKGASGTKVKLQIYRLAPGTTTTSLPPSSDGTETVPHLPEGGMTKEFSLVRREISIPVVEAEDRKAGSKKVAYIRFSTFSDGSGAELRKVVTKAVGTEKVDALVVDLRSNGGGLLSEAIHAASIFVPNGVIVTTQGLNSPKETYAAEGGAISDKVPLYLLMDGYSASASEIVAGALKDTHRAVLVGEKTFGKGLVQTVEPLSNGGALKLTSAVYLTPKGTDINKKGIEPDVKAPDNVDTPVDETLDKTLQLIAAR